jgi:hypothetical protein
MAVKTTTKTKARPAIATAARIKATKRRAAEDCPEEEDHDPDGETIEDCEEVDEDD